MEDEIDEIDRYQCRQLHVALGYKSAWRTCQARVVNETLSHEHAGEFAGAASFRRVQDETRCCDDHAQKVKYHAHEVVDPGDFHARSVTRCAMFIITQDD